MFRKKKPTSFCGYEKTNRRFPNLTFAESFWDVGGWRSSGCLGEAVGVGEVVVAVSGKVEEKVSKVV